MNDELEKLRPEVRDALAGIQGEADCRCSEPYKSRGMKDPQCNHDLQDSVDVIRAELLRLADDCARLVDCINAQPPTRRSLIDRAERAEAELAALKARIAGSDAGIVTQTSSHLGSDGADTTTVEAYPPKVFHHTAIGQRVRLVVENDNG